MNIKENLNRINSSIPNDIVLVAVSKTKPIQLIMDAYDNGQRIFGENKVQEMVAKWESLPKDIQWHMIGNVQRNKVKYMAPFVSLIHGVDSLKLLLEINKQAKKNNRIIDCLLQVHIAREDTKYGFSYSELKAVFNEVNSLDNVSVKGLMGMASFCNDNHIIEKEFRLLKSKFDFYNLNDLNFKILSMGMSGDYDIAIDCGSTMIRVGSKVFGSRD
tara:strand:- start:1016 stop:1663 length:648 start_codon:yes stop_codon:yes gene_type:complete